MRRENYNIKEFKNGNLVIKFAPDEMEKLNAGRVSEIELLSWALDSLDCYIIGEEFCLSNYDMGCQVYNLQLDRLYIVSFTDIETKLKQGKSLKLYAYKPDSYDRELLAEEGY